MAQLRSHGSLLLVYFSATFSWTSPLSERKVSIVLHLRIPSINAKRPCIFALTPRRTSCASCCRPRKLELKSKNEAGVRRNGDLEIRRGPGHPGSLDKGGGVLRIFFLGLS